MSETAIANNGDIKQERYETINIKSIRENPDALRKVNKNTDEYQGIVDSMKIHGVLNTISVRELKDKQTGELYYALVDGLHRWTAAQDAGIKTITVKVMDLDDIGVLEAQIIGNAQKVETLPVQYAKQILRIASMNPTLTTLGLAQRVGKSSKWVNDRLSLVKLQESIQKLVDEGKMSLLNAYSLAKLEPEDQVTFLDRALTTPPDQFVGAVTARVKEVRDSKRAGRDTKPEEFVPVPHLRRVKELESELETLALGRQLGATDLDSYKLGVQVALNLDQIAVENARVAWVAAKQKRDEDKARRDREKNEKKLLSAQETQSEAAMALEAMGVDPTTVKAPPAEAIAAPA